ncbi:MAG: filamentous hemagglutinin N-terminal domain-containing protein [Alphaproteobacteria bacterium]|nr:filamentous hemagglutinin N-terminal domain-containing protein [Alphaproteobacteria bacterium]
MTNQSLTLRSETANKSHRWSIRKFKKFVVNYCSSWLMGGIVSMSLVNMALAAPTGGQVVSGNATITQDGKSTVIDQSSQVAKIDWTSFSTQTDESVTFNQNNSSSIAINEVIGGVPSFLMGSLTANGRVFIINQAGIVFGKDSRVNVGSLLATTSALTSLDETTGQMTFASDTGG